MILGGFFCLFLLETNIYSVFQVAFSSVCFFSKGGIQVCWGRASMAHPCPGIYACSYLLLSGQCLLADWVLLSLLKAVYSWCHFVFFARIQQCSRLTRPHLTPKWLPWPLSILLPWCLLSLLCKVTMLSAQQAPWQAYYSSAVQMQKLGSLRKLNLWTFLFTYTLHHQGAVAVAQVVFRGRGQLERCSFHRVVHKKKSGWLIAYIFIIDLILTYITNISLKSRKWK